MRLYFYINKRLELQMILQCWVVIWVSVRACCHSQEKTSFLNIIEVFLSGPTPDMLVNKQKYSSQTLELRSVPNAPMCPITFWCGQTGLCWDSQKWVSWHQGSSAVPKIILSFSLCCSALISMSQILEGEDGRRAVTWLGKGRQEARMTEWFSPFFCC